MGKIRALVRKLLTALLNRHWWIVGLVLILIFLSGLEFTEYALDITDTFHVVELIFYCLLLGFAGLLVEQLLVVTRKQEQTMKILDYKHQLSLELMAHEDWDTLVRHVMESLAKIVGAHEAQLFVMDPLLNKFEYASEWGQGPRSAEASLLSSARCRACIGRMNFGESHLHACGPVAEAMPPHAAPPNKSRVRCLTINYRNRPFALIKFILATELAIAEDQQSMLVNVGGDIAIALKAAQERRQSSELRVTEATLAERHTYSQYLHDNLSQNLSYLRMKLDQLNHDPQLLTGQDILTDITRMKLAVDESYGIVRGKLESTRPDSLPRLNNFLQEYANKISQRANWEIEFLSKGPHKTPPVDVQRAVFYVFQEILSNIEKHAQATKVAINLQWARDNLSIEIHDNGVGFHRHVVNPDKHFGLEIAHERLANIQGQMDISPSEDSGTKVRIWVPLAAAEPVPPHA